MSGFVVLSTLLQDVLKPTGTDVVGFADEKLPITQTFPFSFYLNFSMLSIIKPRSFSNGAFYQQIRNSIDRVVDVNVGRARNT